MFRTPSIKMLTVKPARKFGAFVLDPAPTKQALVDYQNAITQVSMYVNGVTNAQLPGLTNPPAEYSNYVNKFSGVKTDVMLWPNSIIPLSQALPQTIISFNTLMQSNFMVANAYLTALIADPSNATLRQSLAKVLGATRDYAKANYTTLTGLEGLFATFNTNLTTDGPILDGLAKQALDFVKGDRDKIAGIQKSIGDLQSQADTLNKWLTVSEIGMGLSIFVGLIGIVCLFVPGGQGIGIGLIAVGVVGEGASIAGTVILNKQINAINDTIQADRGQISQINQDINLLIQLNTQVQKLVTQNTIAQQAMKVVQDYWKTLDTELTSVIAELNDSSTQATSSNFKDAQTDLTAAKNAWDEVNGFANALQGINYVFDNTIHQLPAKQAA